MNKLPGSWLVLKDENNPNWQKVIDYINKTLNKYLRGRDRDSYYGIINNQLAITCNPLNYYYKNCVILTIKQFIEMTEDTFVLPEKWYIIGTPESRQAIYDWLPSDIKESYKPSDNWTSFAYPNNHTNKGFMDGSHIGFTENYGYTKITLEQFKQYVLTEKTTNTMKVQTLTKGQLIDLYNEFTCSDFRNVIVSYLSTVSYQRDDYQIRIEQKHIDKLIKEGTQAQIKAIEALGINIKVDKNAFIQSFSRDEMDEISKKLFGKHIMEICTSGTPSDKPELCGKAFFVDGDYNVEIGPAKLGGTYISILKK